MFKKNLSEIIQDLELDNIVSDIQITGLNTLKDATQDEISFLENKKYLSQLKDTKAGAVFISEQFRNEVPKGTIALVCDVPYEMLAKASKLFAPKVVETSGDDPKIGNNCTIMKNAHIGFNTIIGDNSTVMSGAFIGDNVTLGDNTIIYPNVTIYRDCIVGDDVIIHSGTTIGSDGFGFATTKAGEHIKIYQNGNVIIEDDVEIGANCTIDRATFNSTVIKKGVRIDNLVQIAHNCEIGDGSVIVSQVGISGSTKLGNYVVMGGQSGTVGHIQIAPFSTITARTGVTKSIKKSGKIWSGYPAIEHKTWLKFQAKLSRLLKTFKN